LVAIAIATSDAIVVVAAESSAAHRRIGVEPIETGGLLETALRDSAIGTIGTIGTTVAAC